MKKFIILILAGLLLFATTDCFARGGFGGGGRGGFSSGRSYSSGGSYSSRSYNNTTRVYHYGGGYVHPGMMYGGMGMGYGYSNGLMTGLIIGDMMHPQGTTVYSGGGYGGQALLYPNGAVVDSTGHQVGTYMNGQFMPVQNGQMMAQPVPVDAMQQSPQDSGTSFGEAFMTAGGIIICLILLAFFISLFFV